MSAAPPPVTQSTPMQDAGARTAPVAIAYQEPNGLGVASFVLGLASLAFGFTFVVPVAGLVLGIMALRREPSSRTLTIWGIVLSGVTLGGGVVAVLLGLTLLIPAGLLGLFAI